jgi:hypothetical protein
MGLASGIRGMTMRVVVVTLATATAAGCGAAATPGVPQPGASTATPTEGGCVRDDEVSVRWAPDHPSPATLCVRVGARIVVALYPPELHTWTSPANTDGSVATVGPVGISQEGVLATTITARRPGHAVVTSSARPSDAAPDPVTVPWQLAIDVVD